MKRKLHMLRQKRPKLNQVLNSKPIKPNMASPNHILCKSNQTPAKLNQKTRNFSTKAKEFKEGN